METRDRPTVNLRGSSDEAPDNPHMNQRPPEEGSAQSGELAERAEERTADLALVNALNEAVNRGESLQEIVALLAQESKRIFGGLAGTVYLLSDDEKHLVMQNLNLPPAVARRIEELIGRDIPPIILPLDRDSRYRKILKTGEPQLFNDPETIQELIAEFTRTPHLPQPARKTVQQVIPQIRKVVGIESVLCIPLVSEGEAIGLFDISGREPFTQSDLDRMGTIAGQLTAIIKRKQAEEALRQRNRELSLLNRAGRILSSTLDLDEVLDTILGEVPTALDATGCSVWLIDPETGELVCREATGPQRDIVRGWRLRPGQGLAGWVADHGESLIVPNAVADDRYFGGVSQQTGLDLRSILSVPLWADERVIGVLQAVHTGVDRFDEADLRLLEALAGWAAIAIKQARLYQQAQRELADRKQAEEALRESRQKYRRFFRTSKDCAFITSREGRWLDMNDAAPDFFGYDSKEELRKVRVPDLYADPADREAHIRRIEQQGFTKDYPVDLRRKDGSVINTLITTVAIKDDDDEAVRFQGTIRDVTEERQDREALARRAAQLATLSRVGSRVASILDREELLQLAVDALREDLNYLQAAVLLVDEEAGELYVAAATDNFWEIIPEDYRQPIGKGLVGTAARSGETLLVNDVGSDPRAYRAGEWLSPASLSAPIALGDRVIGVLQIEADRLDAFDETDVIVANILADQIATGIENVRLYEEAQQLAAFNEEIVRNASEGIVAQDADGYLTFVNPAAAAMLGYDAEELVDRYWTIIVPPDQRAIVEASDERRRKGESDRYELELVRRDGIRIPALVSGTPRFDEEGHFAGTLAIFADITERKRTQVALQRYADRLKALHEIDQAIVGAQSPEEIAQAALRRIRDLIPCVGAGIVTFDDGDQEATLFAVDVDDHAEVEAGAPFPLTGLLDVEALEQGQTLIEEDLQLSPTIQTPLQGVEVRCLIAAPILADGDLIGALILGTAGLDSFSSDHTDILREVAGQIAIALRQAGLRAALDAERRRLEAVVEHIPEGILLLDRDHRILLANPAAETYLRVLTEAAIDDTLSHLAGRPVEELLQPPPEGQWHELEIAGPPDRVFELVARPMAVGAEGHVLVIRDVTQEREIQKRIKRQDRLAAVGQLAGGVAHDFNNFLSTIILYSEMMLRKADPALPSDLAWALETIVNESQQASQLVQQILDFSRRSMMETESVDLVPFTREVVEILHQAIPENIQLKVEAAPGPCTVEADPTRIQQALMNLALNARDAMPDGGELRIRLSKVEVAPEEKPPVANVPPGRWICLAVSDTGTGMTEEVQSHLFEPFFTTKEPGKGTGLGLAQVFGIVKQHGGHIDVETEVGQGTTFWIYLPACEAEEGGGARRGGGKVPRGEGETILLVEDEMNVREAGREVLQSLGYRVLTAANGREGLEIYRSAESVDLVLTDLVMPEMGGHQLIEALRGEDPDLRVVAITGYAVQETLEGLREEAVMDVVQKPLRVDELAHVIRGALDGGDDNAEERTRTFAG